MKEEEFTPPARRPQQLRGGFLGFGFSRWIAAGAFACLLLSLALWHSSSASPRIEIGLQSEEAARGGEPLRIKAGPRVSIRSFNTDAAMAAWLQSRFPGGVKARIWIDEGHDLIRIVYPAIGSAPSEERTEPLPASNEARERKLQELVAELNGD